MNSTNVTVDTKNLDSIQSLLFPEILEDSKLISILSDDLSFKICDFLNVKDVQKLSSTNKLETINLLKQINFIKIDENSETCKISLSDDFTLFSLLNVPSNINNKSELLTLLKIEDFDRLYKRNFFVWYLVSTNPLSKDKISNLLKTVKFGEENLKFEIYTSQIIKKNILKRFQQINYQRETLGLKQISNLSSNNSNVSESLSWRKKSTDSEEQSFKRVSKNEKTVSNFETTQSSFKRKRFNSDGGEEVPKLIQENQGFCKMVLNNSIKYRYNLKQLFEVYDHNNDYFNLAPTFINQIEDICILDKRKELNILSPKETSEIFRRDRSKTFHPTDDEIKMFFNDSSKFKLPKNNRNPYKILIKFEINNYFLKNINSLMFFYRKQFFNSQSGPPIAVTKSSLNSIFNVLFNKIFIHDYHDKILNESLQFTIIRANFFYVHCWFIINYLRKESVNMKVMSKLYNVYQVKNQVHQYNKKKLIFYFDDNYNKQVLDELNRSANSIILGLDDYFNSNIMQRSLEDIIYQDILCEKFNNEQKMNDKYSSYINDVVNFKNDNIFKFIEEELDLNRI